MRSFCGSIALTAVLDCAIVDNVVLELFITQVFRKFLCLEVFFTENSAHQKVMETFQYSFVQTVGRSSVDGLLDLLDIALLEESVIPPSFPSIITVRKRQGRRDQLRYQLRWRA